MENDRIAAVWQKMLACLNKKDLRIFVQWRSDLAYRLEQAEEDAALLAAKSTYYRREVEQLAARTHLRVNRAWDDFIHSVPHCSLG